jgi:ribosomal protein S12 methylthiotransferase
MFISLLSLGCDKNLADSEELLRGLRKSGILYTPKTELADVILLNTCAFIEDAKRESIYEILRLAELKNDGKKLLVMGCLAQRYKKELKKEIPEIDAIFGVGEHEKIISYCKGLQTPSHHNLEPFVNGPPELFDGPVAPLKVAEGCDRNCTFCVISSIRGPLRSRRPENVLKEAESYISAGVKELLLVAQDLTGFGKDLGGYGLVELLKDISSISGDFRIRPLYLYPSGITDDLLQVIGDEKKICKYLDLPLQHSEEKVLKAMGRGGGRDKYLSLISRIRDAVPGATLRTTLIVGFPGETGEDFEGLLDFVRKARFERLGVFKYSKEETTRAAQMKGQVGKHIKQKRFEAVMELQAGISLEINKGLVGSRGRVLIESEEQVTALGRLCSQAPEVDGVTIINGLDGIKAGIGEFADVVITRAFDYDLEAKCL